MNNTNTEPFDCWLSNVSDEERSTATWHSARVACAASWAWGPTA